MANVLLVSPTNKIRADLHNWSAPPLGLWRIAGYLTRQKHSMNTVKVWDQILDDHQPAAPKGGWDIIGFSPSHDTLSDDLKLAFDLQKEYPRAIFVAGGLEASTNFQQLMELCPFLKHVIVGEGEKQLDKLCGWVDCNIGSEYVSLGGVTRQVSDFTEYDLTLASFLIPFDEMRYHDHWARTAKYRPEATEDELNCVRMATSTFCDRRCKFCSTTNYHEFATGGPCKPIVVSGSDTQQLIHLLMTKVPGVRYIYFNDDDFCCDPNRAFVFFDDPPPLNYHIQARADTVSLDFLKHAKKGRCVRVSYGIENFSEPLLKEMGKGISRSDIDNAIDWTLEAGIHPIILLILFAPSTTISDLVINYLKCREMQKRGAGFSIMPIVYAYPGTWYLNKGLHEIEYRRTGGIKQPWQVLPDDLDVRALWEKFMPEVERRTLALSHKFKGATSLLMIDVLEDLLKEIGVI